MIKYLLLLLPLAAFASDPHHDHPDSYPIPIIIEPAPQTLTAAPEPDIYGVALGIAASQHHFDFGTHVWQWSAGYGHFDDHDAFSLSIGKRLDRVLINGSIGREGSETGIGVGINGRF